MADVKLPRGFRPFDRLFKSDQRWPAKIGGAAVFGLILAVIVLVKLRDDVPRSAWIPTLVALPAILIILVSVFIWADVVRRRLRDGERVGILPRILFGAGIWSLLLWIIALTIAGIPAALWLGSVTAGR